MEDFNDECDDNAYKANIDGSGGSAVMKVPAAGFDSGSFVSAENLDFDAVLANPLGIFYLKKWLGAAKKVNDNQIRACDFVDNADTVVGSVTAFTGKNLLKEYADLKDTYPASKMAYDAATKAASYAHDDIQEKLVVYIDAVKGHIREGNEKFLETKEFLEFVKFMWTQKQDVDLRDFDITRPLGKGAFGLVSGGKLRFTGRIFAVKKMEKKKVKGKKAGKLVANEKKVLAALGEKPSRHVVHLNYAFDDQESFYLVLPLVPGGDLAFHLSEHGALSLERCVCYIAEIALGMVHLHMLGYLYRDLKPENVLMAVDGHCKISDLGLAVRYDSTKDRRLGRAGTRGYMAPEVVERKAYGAAADWWGLGACMFEFFTACCPFDDRWTGLKSRDDATLAVREGGEGLFFDGAKGGFKHKHGSAVTPFTDDAKDLITKMLCPVAANRMCKMADFRKHPLFKDVNWAHMEVGDNEPPFKPDMSEVNAMSKDDISNKGGQSSYSKITLDETDVIKNFRYINRRLHQADIIEVIEKQAGGVGSKGGKRKPSVKADKRKASVKPAPNKAKVSPKVQEKKVIPSRAESRTGSMISTTIDAAAALQPDGEIQDDGGGSSGGCCVVS